MAVPATVLLRPLPHHDVKPAALGGRWRSARTRPMASPGSLRSRYFVGASGARWIVGSDFGHVR